MPYYILLLLSVQLLNTERLSIFAADLQVSFLLFEALRTHLKFQLEFYLTRVIDIIISDSPKITYEQKEIALGNISVQCK
jgi:brefeldin A-resistance guanine nucleotide exchange factor 1